MTISSSGVFGIFGAVCFKDVDQGFSGEMLGSSMGLEFHEPLLFGVEALDGDDLTVVEGGFDESFEFSALEDRSEPEASTLLVRTVLSCMEGFMPDRVMGSGRGPAFKADQDVLGGGVVETVEAPIALTGIHFKQDAMLPCGFNQSIRVRVYLGESWKL